MEHELLIEIGWLYLSLMLRWFKPRPNQICKLVNKPFYYIFFSLSYRFYQGQFIPDPWHIFLISGLIPKGSHLNCFSLPSQPLLPHAHFLLPISHILYELPFSPSFLLYPFSPSFLLYPFSPSFLLYPFSPSFLLYGTSFLQYSSMRKIPPKILLHSSVPEHSCPSSRRATSCRQQTLALKVFRY